MNNETRDKIAAHRAARCVISRDVHADLKDTATFGERIADGLTSWMGSWSFIGLFSTVCLAWMVVNLSKVSALLLNTIDPYDMYPYQFLNLGLSLMAAGQGSIIMLSQNRQSQKDRALAKHAYEVNLKAEEDHHEILERLERLEAALTTPLITIQPTAIKREGA